MLKRFIFVIALLFSVYCFSADVSDPVYYAVVDAGSSGSRLHLFELTRVQGMPKVREIKLENNEVEPGITVYIKLPDKIKDYFNPLKISIDNALK